MADHDWKLLPAFGVTQCQACWMLQSDFTAGTRCYPSAPKPATVEPPVKPETKPKMHAFDFDDFEYGPAFRAKWEPLLADIEAEKDRAREFAVKGKCPPVEGFWIRGGYGYLWYPVRPEIKALEDAYYAACENFEADWLKAKLRALREKGRAPRPVPNFTEWDRQDNIARAMQEPVTFTARLGGR